VPENKRAYFVAVFEVSFRDRLELVLGNGGQQPEGNRRLLAAHRRHSRSFVGPAG
jgi:hypothetical protein